MRFLAKQPLEGRGGVFAQQVDSPLQVRPVKEKVELVLLLVVHPIELASNVDHILSVASSGTGRGNDLCAERHHPGGQDQLAFNRHPGVDTARVMDLQPTAGRGKVIYRPQETRM